MYRRSRNKGCNMNVIHRITSETIRLSEMELKPDNKPKNSEIAGLQQSRKNQSGSFQITSVCVTGRFDTGEDSADDLDESRTEDISRLDNETPSFSEDTFSRDGDECHNINGCTMPSPNKTTVPSTSSAIVTATSSVTTVTEANTATATTSAIQRVSDRFKVVKIESVTPFHRGRWRCLDYVDYSKHTPSDGWVYRDDQYVKLSEVKIPYTQTASTTTIATPPKTEPLVCTFTRPTMPINTTDTTSCDAMSYQRQYSAPVPGYSIHNSQQFIYGNSSQFLRTQPQTSHPSMQWQYPQALAYQPQQWYPQPLLMQYPIQQLPEQSYNQIQQSSVQQVSPVHQKIVQVEGSPQHSVTQTVYNQMNHLPSQLQTSKQEIFSRQHLLGKEVPQKGVTAVRRVKDDSILTSSMPPTPTTTPREFGEKVSKRKTSSPEIEDIFCGPLVKTSTTTNVNGLPAGEQLKNAEFQLSKTSNSEATNPVESVRSCSQVVEEDIRKIPVRAVSENEGSIQVIDIRNMATAQRRPMISPPQATPLANLPKLLPDLNFSDATLFAVYCFVKNFIGASGANTAAIDSKIEQAMDLVKDHLLYTVREEVEVLKERIAELVDRINQLELENNFLRANASPEVLYALNSGAAVKQGPPGAK